LWNIAFGKFEGAALIESHRDTIRSNHYHLTDWHYLAVVSGRLDYYWRKVSGPPGSIMATTQKQTFKSGDVFFTPPRVMHALYFHEHTVLVSLSRNARRHYEHEADLVRSQLIEIEDDVVKLIPAGAW
jgi:dTDP-4-dehydrorhamnose 3,5-epimerase-like enzyme